jgi:Cu-Zn family superoxide dismutase
MPQTQNTARGGWGFVLRAITLGAIAALTLLALPRGLSAQTDERCFSETGFCISGPIRAYWERNGGLPVFGFPLGPQGEFTVEGRMIQAQWFERTRLELHPENAPPYDVLLGRSGVEVLERQGRDWFAFPRSEAREGCRFFPETGHNVCGAILAAWQASGLDLGEPGVSYAESLALFGLPLSDEREETIQGRSYTVQWFERGRFELHPENAPPYNVLLGRLGAEIREGQGQYRLPGDAVFPEGVAFQPSTGDFFVSSTGDGTIFRGNVERAAAEPFLAPGADERTTAVGLKVDDARGRLFVAGGATGRLFVYDVRDRSLVASFDTGRQPTFINDVAVAPNGDAFFTDSQSPVIYRVFAGANGGLVFEPWLDLTGTAIRYQEGFNLNGIEVSDDGAHLVVVQSNTGRLFRITIASQEVAPIDLGGESLTNGDGILLEGQILYVVRNQQGLIVKLRLADDLLRGTVESSTGDPSLAYPTTIARAGQRLLVVNSQFNRRGPGLQPALPFTVASIPAP